MSFRRDTRIRWIASAVMLTAAVLFTQNPADLAAIVPAPAAAGGVVDVVCNLLLAAIAVVGLRHTWHAVLGRVPNLAPAPGLPWLLLFAVALLQAVAAISQLGLDGDAGPWSRLPAALTLAAFLGLACSEHVGLRQGVFTLPVLLAVALLAVHLQTSQGDGRYLLWLQLSAVTLPVLLCILLPVATSHRSDWLAAAVLLAVATVLNLVPGTIASVQPLATAAAVLALLRGLRRRPLC